MPNFETMTPEQFIAWQKGTELNREELSEPQLTPASAPAQDVRPATEVWGSNEYDFVCPSGAKCRMKKLMPETLIQHGILDKIATLPAYAAEVVDQAEGLPPKSKTVADSLPSKEELKAVTEILEILVPMVVVQPRVWPVPVYDEDGNLPDRVEGYIYTDSIELMDRVAIMERAVHGVKKLEPFREGSS